MIMLSTCTRKTVTEVVTMRRMTTATETRMTSTGEVAWGADTGSTSSARHELAKETSCWASPPELAQVTWWQHSVTDNGF